MASTMNGLASTKESNTLVLKTETIIYGNNDGSNTVWTEYYLSAMLCLLV